MIHPKGSGSLDVDSSSAITSHLLHVPGAAENSNQDEWNMKLYGELQAFCPRRGVFCVWFPSQPHGSGAKRPLVVLAAANEPAWTGRWREEL